MANISAFSYIESIFTVYLLTCIVYAYLDILIFINYTKGIQYLNNENMRLHLMHLSLFSLSFTDLDIYLPMWQKKICWMVITIKIMHNFINSLYYFRGIKLLIPSCIQQLINYNQI